MYFKFFKTSSLLMTQHLLKDSMRTREVDQVPLHNNIGLCQKYPFLPSLSCGLVTVIRANELPHAFSGALHPGS